MGFHYFEIFVFLFNTVIYVSLLLCLRILNLGLCIFIAKYEFYSVSLSFLCTFCMYCTSVLLPPGFKPIAVTKMYLYLK